jgi:hypothetical protein
MTCCAAWLAAWSCWAGDSPRFAACCLAALAAFRAVCAAFPICPCNACWMPATLR